MKDQKDIQAFPTLSSTNVVGAGGKEHHAQEHYYNPGMTLRDYMATAFMAARLANPNTRTDVTDTELSVAAYQRADAMLRVRQR